ncbi:MAG: hypothetical protein P8Y17_02465 [Patescibacteria group bacterium]|jgi:hypothetical protein
MPSNRYKKKQGRLPGFEDITPIKRKRRFPQPRLRKYRTPRKYELIYRPLDLSFRGQLNRWIIKLQENISLKDILLKEEKQMIDLYLFPQDPQNKWLNQKQVMKKITGNPNSNLKRPLVKVMLKIWAHVKK